jgi:hypothetical protein
MQYAPQIYKTYKAQLVGALSLGTMVIQVPGSVLFVVSIAVRQGTDWTSWLAYAVTGGMQGALLVGYCARGMDMCSMVLRSPSESHLCRIAVLLGIRW